MKFRIFVGNRRLQLVSRAVHIIRDGTVDQCRSNLAAEGEKQTRKQLEDALAPNTHLRAIERSS